MVKALAEEATGELPTGAFSGGRQFHVAFDYEEAPNYVKKALIKLKRQLKKLPPGDAGQINASINRVIKYVKIGYVDRSASTKEEEEIKKELTLATETAKLTTEELAALDPILRRNLRLKKIVIQTFHHIEYWAHFKYEGLLDANKRIKEIFTILQEKAFEFGSSTRLMPMIRRKIKEIVTRIKNIGKKGGFKNAIYARAAIAQQYKDLKKLIRPIGLNERTLSHDAKVHLHRMDLDLKMIAQNLLIIVNDVTNKKVRAA